MLVETIMGTYQHPQQTFVHHGSSTYDPTKFQPIRNRFVKPYGGLWATPVGSETWKDWCQYNWETKPDKDNLKSSFTFGLKKDTNVYVIDDLCDLLQLPKWTAGYSDYIDFEQCLHSGVDAIHLTEKGQWDTRLSSPMDLYGWDLESILVMNPDVIVL
jgi:hypothetical protein